MQRIEFLNKKIMKNQKNYKHLMKLGKHFIKVLKTEGIYRQFLAKYSNGVHSKSINNSNGALFEAMMNDVMILTMRDLDSKGRDINNLENEYEYITNILNMLLHKYVESGMHIHPDRCAKMGEKIFNAFCSDIFGEEKFKKDMDDFHAAHMGEMENEAILKKEFIGLRKRGLNMSWEEFLNIKSKLMAHMRTDQANSTSFNPRDFNASMFPPSMFYINHMNDEEGSEDMLF